MPSSRWHCSWPTTGTPHTLGRRMKPGGRWRDLPGVSSAPFPPRIYGQACATYESASLRMFHLGRTDTIRSASMDSLTFVKAMDDPSVTVRDRGQGWESWVRAFLPSSSSCQCTLSVYYIPDLWWTLGISWKMELWTYWCRAFWQPKRKGNSSGSLSSSGVRGTTQLKLHVSLYSRSLCLWLCVCRSSPPLRGLSCCCVF